MTIEERVMEQRKFFDTGITRDVSYRYTVLGILKQSIKVNEAKIVAALKADLNKSEAESYMTEIGIVLEEISYIMRHLFVWTKKKRVPTPLSVFPGKSFVLQEPYGVALIMSPWNYPFQLAIAPLIGALAAGNCVILKPSNYSPNVSQVIADMIGESFESRLVDVVLGGRAENKDLLTQKFDYIFFTGGVTVGKLVMEAAAKNLTPVTLELGGKSPCIVDETANLRLTAKRLAFGKYLNSGQTCVAPDYLLVHQSVKDELISYLKEEIVVFYGAEPLKNDAYPRIVNKKHYERVMGLIAGEKICIGGQGDEECLKIAPTILDQITWDSPVMQEEIFGPVLPVLTFAQLDKAIKSVRKRPKPLALYLFTKNKKTQNRILDLLSFGGGCINDTIMHLANSHMGFGGVGESGMGSYHGKQSFETFSHKKSIVKRGNWPDISLRYHPFTTKKLNVIKKIIK